MKGYTVGEAAVLLKQPTDYLLKIILFSGKTHPILKPCIFLSEPTSMRLAHRNANIYVTEAGIDHTMQSINALPADPAEAARQIRVNRHWPEDACTPFKYPQVTRKGLFELTFYPEYIDMAEFKESGRVQLYMGKAVQAPLTNTAVDRIINNWYALSQEEICRAKDRIRRDVGDIVILTQDNLHYLVDTPVSIPLSDIRITDKMLTEYAASEGIKLSLPPMAPAAIVDQTAMQATVNYNLQEILPIRFIEFYTGGKLGPECTALLFAHKQGIDWNRQMEAEDKLTAYHWQHGKPIALKRTEWESVLISIQSLSDRYNKTERHFDEWRTAALKLLPVAYVRRSEFDAAYRRAMSPERITFVDQSREFKRLTGDEDKEARQTIDTPYIPPELVGIVFEGFGHYTSALPPQLEPKLRHKISKDEWKSKRKSAIQLAVEAFLDDSPEGNKAGFYAFLKKQLNLQKEEPFKDGQPYAYYFKDVKEKGKLEGVYLQHPKEGKKEGNPSWNHYAGNEISSIISKERGRRKKTGI